MYIDRGVQYVLSMMHKCIMVKEGEAKKRPKIGGEIYKVG